MAVIHEPIIRLAAFIAVLAAMMLWETIAPRRSRSHARTQRWPSNFAIVVLNTGLFRILLPSGAIGVALLAEQRRWCLLYHLPIRPWGALLISVVALDLAVYLQHVMFHAVPALWRVHRVHHSDLDFDVTTGARFHPIEIGLSMLIKLGAVAALGASALAVLAFEVLLNATSMFNHGNVRIPAKARPSSSMVCGHARHAPHSSFDPGAGDQQQLRLQPPLVGSVVGDLSRPARRGTRP